MAKRDKYYGWWDVANFNEAIIFYAEMFSHGYHHHEICRMLDNYFPNIDTITLKKIRNKAYVWMRGLVTNIETKIYLAKSIVRLERICANPKADIKYVLAADSQLTHILGLANVREESGPEELAALIRAFNKKAREASDGTAYKEKQEAAKPTEATKHPEATKATETKKSKPPSQTKPIDELEPTEDEKITNETLIKSRAVRLKIEIEIAKEELRQETESRQSRQEQGISQDLINLAAFDQEDL